MPIARELKQYYGREWKAIRDAIILRQAGQCKRCGAPDRTEIYRSLNLPAMWFDRRYDRWRDGSGHVTCKMLKDIPERRRVTIVLTVAHLNHDPRDNREDNLAGLCQRCHLLHDRKQHAATARRTRAEKRRQMWLLPELAGAHRAEGL